MVGRSGGLFDTVTNVGLRLMSMTFICHDKA
jgi:hypothetical protein